VIVRLWKGLRCPGSQVQTDSSRKTELKVAERLAADDAERELLDFLYGDGIQDNLACTLNALYWEDKINDVLEAWLKENYNVVRLDTFCSDYGKD